LHFDIEAVLAALERAARPLLRFLEQHIDIFPQALRPLAVERALGAYDAIAIQAAQDLGGIELVCSRLQL
jgi:hypothetical protein